MLSQSVRPAEHQDSGVENADDTVSSTPPPAGSGKGAVCDGESESVSSASPTSKPEGFSVSP